jgi:hypothetical protein
VGPFPAYQRSKIDLEVLLFHLIDKNSGVSLSNADLALALRTSVSKIKRFRDEAVLRFAGEDLEKLFRQRFCAHLQSATFEFPDKSAKNKTAGPRMVLVIEDEFLRSQLLGKLKKHGSYADWSFNSELLKVCPKTLMKVAMEAIPEDGQKKLATKLRPTVGAKLEAAFVDAFEGLVEAAKHKANASVIELAVDLNKTASKQIVYALGALLLL